MIEAQSNFLEFVEEGQMLRHQPSGLVGKCVSKSRTAYVDARPHSYGFFVNATLEFPSGRRITFNYPFLEAVDG